MKKYIIYTLLLGFSFTSCDKVDDPFPKDQGTSISLDGNTQYITDPSLNITDTTTLKNLINNNVWDTISSPNNSTKRFIVIEEFTGHQCLNCPRGARKIMQLDSIYGEQLIPVAIHAGSFAQPFPPSHGSYTKDFRVAGGYGDTYLNTFGVSGYPSAMVSRTNNGEVMGDAQWEARIKTIKDDQPKAVLSIKNYVILDSNASDSKIIRIQIDIEWLADVSGDHNLQLYLTEDHIIAWQLDGSVDVEFYDHRHMLRKVVNGAFGLKLASAKMGEKESFQYITSIDNDWKPKNMESIAFIFNQSPSYEILQGNAAHLR